MSIDLCVVGIVFISITYNTTILGKSTSDEDLPVRGFCRYVALFRMHSSKGFSVFVRLNLLYVSYYKVTNRGSQCIFKVSRHEG